MQVTSENIICSSSGGSSSNSQISSNSSSSKTVNAGIELQARTIHLILTGLFKLFSLSFLLNVAKDSGLMGKSLQASVNSRFLVLHG